MFNPLKAAEIMKDELINNPALLREWNKLASTDPAKVRKDIIAVAEKHGVKMSEGELKLALKAGKPFLGKLNPDIKQDALELFDKLT